MTETEKKLDDVRKLAMLIDRAEQYADKIGLPKVAQELQDTRMYVVSLLSMAQVWLENGQKEM